MAQVTLSVEALQAEEASLQIPTFDYDFAWTLGSLIRTRAMERQHSVAIDIRHGSDLIFATLLPGATIDNLSWTRRKSAVVHRFHRSSLRVRLEAEAKGYDVNAKFALSPADYVASGGGFPLTLKGGILVGTVAVSGLPDVEDHALITECLRQLMNIAP